MQRLGQEESLQGDEDRENRENNKIWIMLKKEGIVNIKGYTNVKHFATRTLSVPLTGAASIIFKWKYHMQTLFLRIWQREGQSKFFIVYFGMPGAS